ADADATTDSQGTRFGDALEAIGWRGELKAGAMPLSAYLELHIEQGPILEMENKAIGVVTGAQGVRWYEATIIGRESHARTTPMPRRADAFIACAQLALEVQAIALAHKPTAVGTVGRVEVEPNSPNVVPGRVRMTVDLRHHEDAVLEDMQKRLYAAIEEIALEDEVDIALKRGAGVAGTQVRPRLCAGVGRGG